MPGLRSCPAEIDDNLWASLDSLNGVVLRSASTAHPSAREHGLMRVSYFTGGGRRTSLRSLGITSILVVASCLFVVEAPAQWRRADGTGSRCDRKEGTVVYSGPKTSLYAEEYAVSLQAPWDLTWGPEGALWVSEMHGRISRVRVPGAPSETMAIVPVDGLPWTGLMGLAFDARSDMPLLYAAASYTEGGVGLQTRVLALPLAADSLGDPASVLDGIPGGGNHNGGRLALEPNGSILLTTGDGGRPSSASDPESLAGKILRLTPVTSGASVQVEVLSVGHRNPQGLDISPWSGEIYASEHGATLDEVNLIEAGADYGWPRLEGRCATNGQNDVDCDGQGRQPLVALGPAIGAAGLAVYSSRAVAAWSGDLLVVGLRGERLVRIDSALPHREVEVLLKRAFGRLRDVAVGEDGAIYVATSNRDGIAAIDGVRADERDDRIIRLAPCKGPFGRILDN